MYCMSCAGFGFFFMGAIYSRNDFLAHKLEVLFCWADRLWQKNQKDQQELCVQDRNLGVKR